MVGLLCAGTIPVDPSIVLLMQGPLWSEVSGTGGSLGIISDLLSSNRESVQEPNPMEWGRNRKFLLGPYERQIRRLAAS